MLDFAIRSAKVLDQNLHGRDCLSHLSWTLV